MSEECQHERILHVGGKTADMGWITYPGGTEENGYLPSNLGIGDSEYISLRICIDCGKVMGLASAEDILKEEAKVKKERGWAEEDEKWAGDY